MSTSRVSGPSSPEPNRPSQETTRKETQKVEKVREIDPDEKARQRRRDQFRMMMEEDQGETAPPSSARTPSPYESAFYRSEADPNAVPEADSAAVPSPQSSPPPDLSSPPSIAENIHAEDLPQSSTFWSQVDVPEQPPSGPQVHSSAVKKGEGGPAAGSKERHKELTGLAPPSGKEETLLVGKKKETSAEREPRTGAPAPLPPGKETSSSWAPPSDQKGDEKRAPSGRFWTPEGETEVVRGAPIPEKEERRREPPPRSRSQPEAARDGFEPPPPAREFLPEQPPSFAHDDQPQRRPSDKGREEPATAGVVAPSATPLPTEVQPIAAAAAQAAAPYLSPEVVPLFYQMVGSILIMTMPPGIRRTEVVLNAPRFANSKFYGSTIEITQYSTAPDSLNIRLTGSNQAVEAFRQNIPSLMSAFQNGNFAFRIGRLEANYSADRPLFHRKGRSSQKGDADSDAKGGRS